MSTVSRTPPCLEDTTHIVSDAAISIPLLPPSYPLIKLTSFLMLPFEIRKTIYKFLFRLEESKSANSRFDPSETYWERYFAGLPGGSHPQILATCRQIHEEANDLLYSCNTANVVISEYSVSLITTRNTRIKLHHSDDSDEPISHKARLFEGFKIFFPDISPYRQEILSERTFGLIGNAKWFCQQVLRDCRRIRYLEISLDVGGLMPTRIEITPDEEVETMSQGEFVCEECIHGLEDFRLVSVDDYMKDLVSGPLLEKTYSHHILDAFREVRRVEKAVVMMGEGEVPQRDLDVLSVMITQDD